MEQPEGPQTPHAAAPPGGPRFTNATRATTAAALVGALLLAVAAGFGAGQAPHPDMWRSVENWDIGRWDWWAYPLERNAFRRVVVRGDLRSLHALPDGSQLWAVGSGGLILHSADGGTTWEQQNPPLPPASAARSARGFDWLPSAQAAVAPPSPGEQRSLPNANEQRVLPNPVEQRAAPNAAQQAPPDPKLEAQRNAERAKVEAATRVVRPRPVASAPAAPSAAASTAANTPSTKLRGDPLLSNLNAVVFADALHGWAAGSDGIVLATSDGGRSWVPQAAGTDATLTALAALPDGLHAWVVGERGSVLATADGGQTWRAGAAPSDTALTGVAFAGDGRRGWVVDRRGSIFATDDGAQTWRAQTRATAPLNSVRFARDGQRGWAAGAAGLLLGTADGGRSWTGYSAAGAGLYAVAFAADARRGLAAGIDGVVLATSDGGQTWQPRNTGTRAALTDVALSDDGTRAWAVGTDGSLLRSIDGGVSWLRQSAGAKAALTNVRFDPAGQRGWVTGFDGALLATGDGGHTWTVRPTGTPAALLGLALAADRQRLWAVGDKGVVLASRDAGASWLPQPSRTDKALVGADFLADGERGWLSGAQGLVLSTRDGGQSWQQQTPFAVERLAQIRFTSDGQRGISAGADAVLTTTDGAQSWQRRPRPGKQDIFGLAVTPNGQRAWLAGADGELFASRDGALTWTRQQSGTHARLGPLLFLADGLRGWAVGERGTVLATVDGGDTWTAETSNTAAALAGLDFLADGKRGWAVGEGATLLGSSDGGRSWSPLADYQRYPPPWMSVALAASVALLAYAIVFGTLRRPTARAAAPRAPDVLAALLSDRPLTDLHDDRLGHGPAVLALSDFMRNRDTEPKLTLAITAPWGMGKSSMMGMLRNELHKAGYRTAWFNAWHHQQEGRQLTALFNVIRKQAVPSIFAQPFAALRVRSRLLWARGWGYRLGIPLLALPLLALLVADLDRGRRDGELSLDELVRWNFAHHWLKEPRIAISGHSLVTLNPFAAPVPAAAASAPAGAPIEPKIAASANPCASADAPRKPDAALRSETYCWLQRAVVLQADGDREACGVKEALVRGEAAQRKHGLCIFESAEQLFDIADASVGWKHPAAAGADPARYLLPSERQAIVGAAEVLDPPHMMPTIEHFVPLLALLGLLVTKGLSVYGFQLLSPLRSLVGGNAPNPEGGNEPSGTIERYRTEFFLLTEALGGRLVVFIDDLDRCDKATVNSMLEMTNYLIDHGRCFIVIGAAMEHVKRCIEPKVELPPAERDAYQVEYLRKIVHIELPVPVPTDSALEDLLNGKRRTGPQAAPRWHRQLGAAAAVVADRVRPPLLVLGVLLLALWVASGVWRAVRTAPHSPHVLAIPAPQAASGAAKAAPDALPAASAAAAAEPRLAERAASGAVGLAGGSPTDWRSFAPAAMFGAALLFFAVWVRRSGGQLDRLKVALGGVVRTADSLAFMAALSLWKPAVRLYDPTPRGLKRFVNRARLFAIHEHGAHPEADTAEVQVVALTAIHHASPRLLREIAAVLEAGNVVKLRAWARARLNEPDLPATETELLNCLDLHIGFWDFADAPTVERFSQLLAQIAVR